jgi:hypothetical protein
MAMRNRGIWMAGDQELISALASGREPSGGLVSYLVGRYEQQST